MNATELADKIVDVVHRYGDCTHGMMIQRFGDAVVGGYVFGAKDHNIFWVVGASELLCESLNILHAESPKRVEPGLCHTLVALHDGTPIPHDMPFVKRPPRNGRFDEPHFYPLRLVRAA